LGKAFYDYRKHVSLGRDKSRPIKKEGEFLRTQQKKKGVKAPHTGRYMREKGIYQNLGGNDIRFAWKAAIRQRGRGDRKKRGGEKRDEHYGGRS